MARTVKQQDAQVRLAIRAEKDTNPDISYKDLQAKFGVTYGTVILAMKRTADEWRAMLDASGARTKPLKPSAPHSEAPETRRRGRPPAAAFINLPESQQTNTTLQVVEQLQPLIQTRPQPVAWEYKAIIVRGKADQGAPTFAFQDKSSSAWQSLADPSFDDVLSLFGRDGWELINMTVLSHANQPFTGLFEIVFKRARR